MSKYLSGTYEPTNPDKYVGSYPIKWRSAWELTVCRMCDNHPNILEWASEPFPIPYRNPLTNKSTVYVPDFLVVMEDKNGRKRTELWEIKPRNQTFLEESKRPSDKLAFAINMSKWKAAQKFCSNRGITFRVINEDSIYRNPKKR